VFNKILFLISISLALGLLIHGSLVYGQSIPKTRYSPTEFIVKYKPGQATNNLKLLVLDRQKKAKNIINRIVFFFGDFKTRITNKKTPEDRWVRFESLNKTLGILSETNLSPESKQVTDLYVVKTNGKLDILKVIESYKQLPEVEYAEPNYLYETLELP